MHPFSITTDRDVKLIRKKNNVGKRKGDKETLRFLHQRHLGRQSTTLPLPIKYCSHCNQYPLRHTHKFDAAH